MPRGVYERKAKTVKERFWSKVQVAGSDECWNWTGGVSEGYGRFWQEGRTYTFAHRYSLMLSGREIAEGDDVRHLCHNRRCVNPSHLLTGSRFQNMQDMVDSGRSMKGERQPNSKMTWENVAEYRRRHALGEGASVLAREAGVNESTMRKCLAGQTWQMETGAK